jgi:hypothetical protein
MSEGASTEAKIVLPKSKRFYLWASALYGLCAITDVGLLFWNPTPYRQVWPWTNWLPVGVSAYFIWFFSRLLSSIENRIEKIVCVLSIARFASSILQFLSEMGYHWAHIPAIKPVNAGITNLAAALVLVRTLQFIKEAPTG